MHPAAANGARYVAWHAPLHVRGATHGRLDSEALDASAVEFVCGLAAADRGVAMGCACGVGYDGMLRLADAVVLEGKWLSAAQLLVAAGLLAVNGLRPPADEGAVLTRAAALLRTNLEADADANALEHACLQRMMYAGGHDDMAAAGKRVRELVGRNAGRGDGAAKQGVVQAGANAMAAASPVYSGARCHPVA